MKTVLIVLDSVGAGALPDALEYDPEPGNTLGNVARFAGGLKMPNLEKLGIGKIGDIAGLAKDKPAVGGFGKMAEQAKGKDTTAGHWEMMGVILKKALPTFPQGFPYDFILAFQEAIGRQTLGNFVASGTEIIQRYGEYHMESGCPIVYTSADSVFQIAAHEEVIPVYELYRICEIARDMLQGEELGVGRVIARPFIGEPGSFTRTANRKDFSLSPTGPTLLDTLARAGQQVIAVGKISDIFNGRGISESHHTENNADGARRTLDLMDRLQEGLIFTNLVDFDMLYGHRNNAAGYAQALEEVDGLLAPVIEKALADDWLLLVTADHGNDPTTPDTDHNREYVPVLACGGAIRANVNLGVRESFSDIAATIARRQGVAEEYRGPGKSFYELIKKA
ncbi:MAG: phosphopentomutase [Peptococcaceae bacterium]|nr:phosphopentomutase [Peptococcaceae bacterium]